MNTKPLSFWSTYPAFVLGATTGLIALTPLKATCHDPEMLLALLYPMILGLERLETT